MIQVRSSEQRSITDFVQPSSTSDAAGEEIQKGDSGENEEEQEGHPCFEDAVVDEMTCACCLGKYSVKSVLVGCVRNVSKRVSEPVCGTSHYRSFVAYFHS